MTTFNTSREIPARPEDVFAAFSDPERIARWWGPDGFTNNIHVFDFVPGGRWSLTMHSPNGGNPANEAIFETIGPRKIVIRHVSQPLYRLTVELTPTEYGTVVSWSQAFDDDNVAARIEKIVRPANEQNLERLAAEVLGDDQ